MSLDIEIIFKWIIAKHESRQKRAILQNTTERTSLSEPDKNLI